MLQDTEEGLASPGQGPRAGPGPGLPGLPVAVVSEGQASLRSQLLRLPGSRPAVVAAFHVPDVGDAIRVAQRLHLLQIRCAGEGRHGGKGAAQGFQPLQLRACRSSLWLRLPLAILQICLAKQVEQCSG